MAQATESHSHIKEVFESRMRVLRQENHRLQTALNEANARIAVLEQRAKNPAPTSEAPKPQQNSAVIATPKMELPENKSYVKLEEKLEGMAAQSAKISALLDRAAGVLDQARNGQSREGEQGQKERPAA